MSDIPLAKLHRLLVDVNSGRLGVRVFCEAFEMAYNHELDRSVLSAREALVFAELFAQVAWYSPFPEERALIPHYRSEADILNAAASAATRLSQPIA